MSARPAARVLPDADRATLVRALSTAIASSPGAVRRPGELRDRVDAAVPEGDRVRLGPLVHQLAAAAEEQVPLGLTTLAPPTAEGLDRLAADLAQARGWKHDVAARTVGIWGSALGLGVATTSTSSPTPASGQQG